MTHWLHELAAEAHETAKARGFEPPNWENFYTKMAMVATEIVEVEEAMDAPLRSPTGIGYELADVALRTLDILHCLAGPEGWSTRFVDVGRPLTPPHCGLGPFEPPGEMTKPLRRYWRAAVEAVRHGQGSLAIDNLVRLLEATFELADRLGLPLRAHITLKNDINKNRPHLNGKKDPRA